MLVTLAACLRAGACVRPARPWACAAPDTRGPLSSRGCLLQLSVACSMPRGVGRDEPEGVTPAASSLALSVRMSDMQCLARAQQCDMRGLRLLRPVEGDPGCVLVRAPPTTCHADSPGLWVFKAPGLAHDHLAAFLSARVLDEQGVGCYLCRTEQHLERCFSRH